VENCKLILNLIQSLQSLLAKKEGNIQPNIKRIIDVISFSTSLKILKAKCRTTVSE
jgi:hypothetical protein